MRSRSLAAGIHAISMIALLSAFAPLATAHTRLTSPDGGEILTAGSVVTIEWTMTVSHPTQNWDLWYSTNGAAGPFIPIATDLPVGSNVVGVPHFFSWTVPDTPSTEVMVRVRMDTNSTDYFDESDNNFTIESPGDPFPSFCFGDGGDQTGCTDCPCMNNAPVGSTGGCLNSVGTSATLQASGNASVSLAAGSTTDLRFGVTGATPGVFCLLTSGDVLAPQNASNPCFGTGSGGRSLFFDGLRCAVNNTRRHGGRLVDPNGEVGVVTNAWGGEGNPSLGIAQAAGGFAAGQTRYFQATHRDDPSLSCMRGLNTTQAVEVTFEP